MDEKYFNERYYSLQFRLENALKAHCIRTARARIREMARLIEEYNETPYNETYDKLIKEYNL